MWLKLPWSWRQAQWLGKKCSSDFPWPAHHTNIHIQNWKQQQLPFFFRSVTNMSVLEKSKLYVKKTNNSALAPLGRFWSFWKGFGRSGGVSLHSSWSWDSNKRILSPGTQIWTPIFHINLVFFQMFLPTKTWCLLAFWLEQRNFINMSLLGPVRKVARWKMMQNGGILVR